MWEAWRVEALRCIERPEIGIYRHQYALRGIERRVIDMHKGGWSRKREGTHPFECTGVQGVRRTASCFFFMHDCVAADLTQ